MVNGGYKTLFFEHNKLNQLREKLAQFIYIIY